MNYIIEEDQANKILQYLTKRPFGEVFQLIGIIQTMEKAPEANSKNETIPIVKMDEVTIEEDVKTV